MNISRTIHLDRIDKKSIEELAETDPDEMIRLLDGLYQKQFKLADINIDHRSILHWEQQKLIDESPDSGKWRRYSFFDFVWLRLVKTLREFGLSIPVLKSVKELMYTQGSADFFSVTSEEDFAKQKQIAAKLLKDDEEAMLDINKDELVKDIQENQERGEPWLHIITLSVIFNRVPFYLLFSSKGEMEVVIIHPQQLEQQINSLLNLLDSGNWIVINFTHIISEFYDTDRFDGSTYYNMTPLTRKEKEIIEIIRSGGVNNINITLKAGEEFYVEILRKKPARKILEQIEGIIAKRNYSRITLDSENGKVSYINEVEKRIIK